jgi:hypothetical protein
LESERPPRSKETAADPVHYVDWLTLLGFMSDEEALSTIRSQGLGNLTAADEWARIVRWAKDATVGISGRMDWRPEVGEVDPKYRSRLSKLEAEPTFKIHSAGMRSMRFSLVEISKIHLFQTMVNTEYIESLVKRAPEPGDMEATLKFCLPTQDEAPRPNMMSSFNPTTNTFSAISDSLDLRILGNTHSEDPVTHTPVAGFYYGVALPLTTVVEYRGAFLLKNGCHRAYALHKKGHDFLPCLLGSTDSFQVTGAQVPGSFPLTTILSDKSPVLSDFDSKAAVPVPRRRVKVVATIHAEVQVVPL